MARYTRILGFAGPWCHTCDTAADLPTSGINKGDMAYTRDDGKSWGAASDTTWAELSWAGAGGTADISSAWPIGSVYTSVVATNPATLLGFGTWAAFAAGRVLVGIDPAQSEFDTALETGGAKTATLTVNELPAHTHVQDPHTHVQNAHTHVQNSHTHVIRSLTATTGTATGYEHGTLDTSATENEATEVTDPTTAVNQNATGVNQNATAVNQSAGAGQAFTLMNPYIVVYFWRRTA